MPVPHTRTPLVLVTLATLGMASAGLMGCNNERVTNPPNKVNISDVVAGAGGESSTGGMAGGTTAGTAEGKGPRELATANTEHAPNQEPESR